LYARKGVLANFVGRNLIKEGKAELLRLHG